MYDIAVIGGGPAGASAAVYALRAGCSVCLIHNNGGALLKTDKINNYYGFESTISGHDLYDHGIKQVKGLGGVVVLDEVTAVDYHGEFGILGKNGSYEAKSIILAMGSPRKTPSIKGITELEGRGVSYCAVCDGFFFRNRDVGVLGSGSFALHEASVLLPIAKSVTIFTDGKSPEFESVPDINVITEKVDSIIGKNMVEGVKLNNSTVVSLSGLFIAQGTMGSGDLALRLGIEMKNGYISIKDDMSTNVRGVFAAGDCTGGRLQIAKSVNQGMEAGLSAVAYIKR